MALPSIVVRGKRVVLLSGFKPEAARGTKEFRPVVILAEADLQLSAKQNPDAVAFGYVGGQWFAAA